MQKGDRSVKEITVKELMEMVGSNIFQAESVDKYGIYIRMGQVSFIYDEDMDELAFRSRSAGEISLNVGSSIEYIGIGEDGTIVIEFNSQVSVIEIRKMEGLV